MLRATEVRSQGHWPQGAARGTVTLDYDTRHRRRLALASDAGEHFLLDLPRTEVLREGDGLALSDGTWLEVKAAAEPLLEVRAATPELLMRLAWHLGNRHLPAAIEADRLLIRDDHVIAAMLEGLEANLRRVKVPFTPEGGAYNAGAGHHHGHHHHEHDHHHDHDHDDHS
jgi:urease accessory protein